MAISTRWFRRTSLARQPRSPGRLEGAVHVSSRVHEPLVLFGFLAAATRRLEARHRHPDPSAAAAALRGRAGGDGRRVSPRALRLGVAVGWNPVEFEALGESFKTRGKRSRGADRDHARPVDEGAGAATGPVAQHPATRESIRSRSSGRSRSGWAARARWSSAGRARGRRLMPHFRPGLAAQAVVDRVHGYVKEAGRAPASSASRAASPWRRFRRRIGRRRSPPGATCRGVTHLSVYTVGLGLKTPADHVEMLRRFKAEAQVINEEGRR